MIKSFDNGISNMGAIAEGQKSPSKVSGCGVKLSCAKNSCIDSKSSCLLVKDNVQEISIAHRYSMDNLSCFLMLIF